MTTTAQPRTAGAAGDLPNGLTFVHEDHHAGVHRLRAQIDGRDIGELTWIKPEGAWGQKPGKIWTAFVETKHQRRGVATEMLRRAREIDPNVHHSQALTEQGKAWSQHSGVAHRTAVRQVFYHVTALRDWPSIRVEGLYPRFMDKVWLFDNIGHAIHFSDSYGNPEVPPCVLVIRTDAEPTGTGLSDSYLTDAVPPGDILECIRKEDFHHYDSDVETWRNTPIKREALPSWRDRGERPEAEVLIAPDLGRARRNSYSVYLHGQPHARRPSLAEAKQSIESIHGPLEWTKVEGDKKAHYDRVHGFTTAFNDSPHYWVASLPRKMAAAKVHCTECGADYFVDGSDEIEKHQHTHKTAMQGSVQHQSGTPLDYHGKWSGYGSPERLFITDPDFERKDTGGNWKGTPPDVVAYLDYSVDGEYVYIWFFTTARDRQNKGNGRSLVADLYRRYPGKKIEWGELMDEGAEMIYKDFLQSHTEQTGKGYAYRWMTGSPDWPKGYHASLHEAVNPNWPPYLTEAHDEDGYIYPVNESRGNPRGPVGTEEDAKRMGLVGPFYHGTSKNRAAQIRAGGFRQPRLHNWEMREPGDSEEVDFGHTHRTFFSTDRDEALFFAKGNHGDDNADVVTAYIHPEHLETDGTGGGFMPSVRARDVAHVMAINPRKTAKSIDTGDSEGWVNQITNMHGESTRGRFYNSIIGIIDRHGKRWDRVSSDLPPGLKRGPMGACFSNALHAAINNRSLIYCEGYALPKGLFPMAHAWVVDGEGTVYDPTWEKGSSYFGVPFETSWLVTHVLGKGSDSVFGDEMAGPALRQIIESGLPSAAINAEGSLKTGSEDYWIGHRPTETGPPANDLLEPDAEQGESVAPSDVYDHPQYYTAFSEYLPEVMRTLRRVRGNPDAQIAIYRSLPVGQTSIRTGDWVGLTKEYARINNLHPDDPTKDMPVIMAMVEAKHVRWAMDDLMEWGYFGPPVTARVAGLRICAAIQDSVPNTGDNILPDDVKGRGRDFIDALAAHFGVSAPKVAAEVLLGMRAADYRRKGSGSLITFYCGFPKESRFEYALAHEFAHHLLWERGVQPTNVDSAHGPEFDEAMREVQASGVHIKQSKTASGPKFWHGSPSGDMRGGGYGLHVGSQEAARQALEARIGRRADGKDWDGTQEYGKTLLMGKRSIRDDSRYPYVTGYNMDMPEEDAYPLGTARYGDGTTVPMSAKPDLFEVEIVGPMGNDPSDPRTDAGANANMKRQVTKGRAAKGYYYTNIGEDDGSLSAVVPGPDHVSRTGRHGQKAAVYFMHDVNEPLIDTKPMYEEESASFQFIHPQIATGGAIRRTSDLRILYRAGIRGIVSGRRDFEDKTLAMGKDMGIAFLDNPAADDGQPKPTSWFKACLDFCLPILRRGEKVYIHCHSGVNRGPSLAYVVLRAWTGMGHEEAVRAIESQRDYVRLIYTNDADKALFELGYIKERGNIPPVDFAKLPKWMREKIQNGEMEMSHVPLNQREGAAGPALEWYDEQRRDQQIQQQRPFTGSIEPMTRGEVDDWGYGYAGSVLGVKAVQDTIVVGRLIWNQRDDSKIMVVTVEPAWRSKGVATAMLVGARSIDPAVKHSDNLTPDGQGWSRRVAAAQDVYRGEHGLRNVGLVTHLSEAKAQELAQRILTDYHFPGAENTEVEVTTTRNVSSVGWYMDTNPPTPLVSLDSLMVDDLTVIHECAHFVRNGPEMAGRSSEEGSDTHDSQFMRVYAEMVAKYGINPRLKRNFGLIFGKTAIGPVTLYHGTSVKAAHDIVQNGARPGVNLTANIEAAKQYARYAMGGQAFTKDKRKQGVVLEITVHPGETKVGEYGAEHHFVTDHRVTVVPLPADRIKSVLDAKTAAGPVTNLTFTDRPESIMAGDGDTWIGTMNFTVVPGDEDTETHLPIVTVEDFNVRADYRRRGVGRAMYQHLLERFPPDRFTIAHTNYTHDGAAFMKGTGLDPEAFPQMRWVGGARVTGPDGARTAAADKYDKIEKQVVLDGITFTLVFDPLRSPWWRAIQALAGKRETGYLTWGFDNAIADVGVQERWRRKGLATAMLEFARTIVPDLKHSHALTDDGKAWSQHVGAYNSFEEFSNYVPTIGMWGPPQPNLDPRIFDLADHMLPDVRKYVLDSLDAFWTPLYGDWQKWTRVYLAGSAAAYWWNSDTDLDILLGVDLDVLRQMRPANVDVSDDDIIAHLNAGLITDLRPQMAAHVFEPGSKPFIVTFFVNPDSYQISTLKPYAAYDITADRWVVHPPIVPKDWGWKYIDPQVIRRCQQMAREAEEILALPEPQRSVAGITFFDWVHEGRKIAYSPAGQGWLDPGNLIYAYLEQHPDALLHRLYLAKHPEMATPGDIAKGWVYTPEPLTDEISYLPQFVQPADSVLSGKSASVVAMAYDECLLKGDRGRCASWPILDPQKAVHPGLSIGGGGGGICISHAQQLLRDVRAGHSDVYDDEGNPTDLEGRRRDTGTTDPSWRQKIEQVHDVYRRSSGHTYLGMRNLRLASGDPYVGGGSKKPVTDVG